MKKDYYEFNKRYIGSSDIASLIVVGCSNECKGLKLFELHFAGDGSYYAYIVDETAEIGDHYQKVAEFHTWLKIYDDEGLTFKFHEHKSSIEVYRAGEFGVIIKITK